MWRLLVYMIKNLFPIHWKKQRGVVTIGEPRQFPAPAPPRPIIWAITPSKAHLQTHKGHRDAMAGEATPLTQSEKWACCPGSSQGYPRRHICPIAWAWHPLPPVNGRGCHDCLADWGESLPRVSDALQEGGKECFRIAEDLLWDV